MSDHSSTKRDQLTMERSVETKSNGLAGFENKSPEVGPYVSSVNKPNSVMSYIQWKGLEEPTESGFKCLLCKRDLAYTPQGPVSIPDIPPEVAVLSCGHVFHDHCLLLITPHDQMTNPPCIPCSIGEC